MTNCVQQLLKSAAFRLGAAFVAIAFMLSSTAAREVPQRMEQIVHFYADGQRFMGAVLVAQSGKVILDQGYGSANLEWNIPDSPSTKFRIGSMTKQFTAASILLLEEQGKLKTVLMLPEVKLGKRAA